jgi:hypothetical protein
LGEAKGKVTQKSRKMRLASDTNVFREVLERSYDVLPEFDNFGDEDEGGLFGTLLGERISGGALSPEERADLYYVGFSPADKLELVEKKLAMLEKRLASEEARGSTDVVTQQLIDVLSAAKAAFLEKETVENMTSEKEK